MEGSADEDVSIEPLRLTLAVANARYSSWSLRAFLFLKLSGFPFELQIHKIFRSEGWREEVLQVSSTGKLPALIVHHALPPPSPTSSSTTSPSASPTSSQYVSTASSSSPSQFPLCISESMAIVEFLRDDLPSLVRRKRDRDGRYLPNSLRPRLVDWPRNSIAATAWARSITYEMHTSYLALRDELPWNSEAFHSPRHWGAVEPRLSPRALADASRMLQVWETTRERFGGPIDVDPQTPCYLFGDAVTLPDVWFAPEAVRLLSNSYPMPPDLRRIATSLASIPHLDEWLQLADAETERIPNFEFQVDHIPIPLTLM